MAAGSKEMRNPATRLTDDLIVEILSRLPVKSPCRFRCVSKLWRGLISHPDHRKNLPQTLAGFFYHTTSRERFPESARHFTNVTGWGEPLIRPSLSFLPGYADIDILDCCNGLLLCRSRTAAGTARYIVCNPATEEWVALPESSQVGNICNARLGFDPAVSLHFNVFEFVETEDESGYVCINGLEIYSSKTREWAFRVSGWSGSYRDTSVPFSTVFLNGFLHVFITEYQSVLAVDTEGKAWRTIRLPWLESYYGDSTFIGQSQGHLYYLNSVEDDDSKYFQHKLKVFVLEDYASDNWVLKHSVNPSKLVGMSGASYPMHITIAIHPECNMIFFVSDLDSTIRCYDMDHRKVHVICNMGCKRDRLKRCLPYVPLYLESIAGWN
ncbi:unnamed protein product [Urochloa decumbens]|uniref:F-box domain-containing protein n=1 Tax=Urochloa decumbens TaxID=240449 RepID=A0ABC8WUA8_9POAL